MIDEVQPQVGTAPLVWSRSRRTGVAAAVVIVVAALWRLVAMSHWSWVQDDWVYIVKAYEMPFGDYLTQSYSGHFMPAQFAIMWAITHLAPLDYAWGIAASWSLGVLSLVVWAVLFRRLFGDRWASVIPLVPLALASGFVPIVLWVAAGLQTFSLQLFLGLTLLASLGWVQSGRRRAIVWTVIAYVGGLLFWEKALLIVIPVLGLALLLARDGTGRVLWGRLWRLAAALVVPSIVYLAAYKVATTGAGDADDIGIPRTPGEALSFYWTGLTQHLLPALVGGPWHEPLTPSSAAAVPTTWIQWLLLAGAMLLLVWGLSRRRRGWIPVTTGVLYFLVSLGLVLTSVRYDRVGTTLALDPRYESDVLAVLLLMGTLLLVPARSERGVLRSPVTGGRLPVWAAPVVVAVLLASCLFSSSTLWDSYAPSTPKTWVDNVVSGTTAAGAAAVYDTRPPANVMEAAFFPEYAVLSRMVSPLQTRIRWNAGSTRLLVPDDSGQLRVAQIGSSVTSLPGPVAGCGYLLVPGQPQRVALSGPTIKWDWGAELSGYSERGGVVTVRAGDVTSEVPIGRGLGSSQAVLSASFTDLVLESAAGSGPICISSVRIGLVTAGPEKA